MKDVYTEIGNSQDILNETTTIHRMQRQISAEAFEQLELHVKTALETYSNVHRGTGHYSMISTALFEKARDIIAEYMGLNKKDHVVVFCTPYGSELLKKLIDSNSFQMISSSQFGLPLGIRALAVRKSALPKGIPFQTGGSVARMVSPHFVIWADIPQKFEAGTPTIMNVIAFAVALVLKNQYGTSGFQIETTGQVSAREILYQDELSGYSGLKMLSELNKQLIGRGIRVPTMEGDIPYINFDNAASTPTFLPVWNAVQKTWRQSATVHAEIISQVRKIIAGFIGANQEKYDIFFTSNTTEAINMAARYVKSAHSGDSELVVMNTLMEHNSNELPWRNIPGVKHIRLSVDKEGFVNPVEMESILRKYNTEGAYGNKRIGIVAVSGASNVLGTFNNITEISNIAHRYGAQILVDGAQLVAHRLVDIEKSDIDYFAFSGHKIYAPFGSGALVVRKGLLSYDQNELLKIRNSGEENVIGIAALGKAMVLLQRIGMNVIEENERILVIRLLKGLSALKGVDVFGAKDPDEIRFLQRGGIVSFSSFKKVDHKVLANKLAEQGGIGVRFGCFCSHLFIKHLLGLPWIFALLQNIMITLAPRISNIIPGMVRVSFGIYNEVIEVDRYVAEMQKIMDASGARNKTADSYQILVKKQINDFCSNRIELVFPDKNSIG
jgi:selenocysteine lyase/cysteine desulfurase